jgi:chromosome segregation protein
MVQYLLGRVVVTKDLDTAVALGRELSSYSRIVTLEGDTVSPGGAITGGSLPKNDGNGLLQRRQQVSRLEEAIQASKASLEKEREIAEALESELRQAGLRAKALTEELHRAQLYIKELEKEVALKRNEKSRWDRESLAVHAEVEGLRARLEAEEDERTQRLERLECLEKEAQIWQEKLLQLQTDLALLEQDQIDTQEDYTAAKVSLATLESQIEAGKKEAARYRSILAEEANRIDEIRMTSAAVEEEKVRLQAEVKRLDQAYRQVKVKLSQTEERQSTQTKLRKETQSDLTAREEAHKARLEAKGQLQGELANATRVLDQVISRKARLTELMWDNYNLQPDDLKDLPIPDGDVQEVRRRIRALKDQIQLLGPVDTDMINHFEVVRERYGYLRRQQQDLLEAKEQLGHIIDEMDTVSMTRFMETLGAVQKEFQIVFTKLFGSGSADLVLLHASRLEEVGLDIQVRPPGKKAQNINLLSGGERALTAICLLFALLRVKPSPFCVLDEIDASLDESNLHRFTGLLEDFTQDTQFIVITHRPATMEAADMLYGVTMNKAHISQLVSVQLSEAAAGLE